MKYEKYKKWLPAAACLVLGFLLQNVGVSLINLVGWMLVLAGLVLGAMTLLKGLKRPDSKADPTYQQQDEALSQEIARRRAINKAVQIGQILFTAVMVVAILACIFSGNYVLLVVLGIAWGLGCALLSAARQDVKGFTAENIIRKALDEVFDVTEYDPFGHIPSQKVASADMGFKEHNTVGGNDYVKGFYKGLPIEMCDVCLIKKTEYQNDDGSWESQNETAFRGFWLICDFQRELAADIRLWETFGVKKLLDQTSIQLENEQFSKKFHVECASEEEAFCILTPHMMEYILEMDNKARGETHLRFDRSGKVHVVIGKRQDSFEVGRDRSDATQLRKKFVQEIRYITDLIDELRLVDTLYKT